MGRLCFQFYYKFYIAQPTTIVNIVAIDVTFRIMEPRLSLDAYQRLDASILLHEFGIATKTLYMAEAPNLMVMLLNSISNYSNL